MDALKQRIRHVPDFPKPGILFYDVTTLLKDREGFRLAVEAMAEPYLHGGVDLVIGIESRGFIFGSAMADRLKTGFAPVRKLGKLPSKTRRASYALEYGADSPGFTRMPRRQGSGCDRGRPARDGRHAAALSDWSMASARTSSASSS
jgi:adenine phosphoribosyltransferase